MRKTLLASFFLSSFLGFSQIYTPSGTISGSSGNNNVGIGTNATTNARLTVTSNGTLPSLKLQTSSIPVMGGGYSAPTYAFELFHNATEFGTNTRTFYLTPSGLLNASTIQGTKFKSSSLQRPQSVLNKTPTNQLISDLGIYSPGTFGPALLFYANDASSTGYQTGIEFNADYSFYIRPDQTIFPNAQPFRVHNSGDVEVGELLFVYHDEVETGSNAKSATYLSCANSEDGSFFKVNGGGGYVLIGKETCALNQIPDANYHLQVDGGIRTERVKVDIASVNGWADYVFADDYKLMTIDELEIFIKENKHLPGVPTAEDVVENGVELGEMNKILLEKIEEQALLLIQLKKEVEELKSRK